MPPQQMRRYARSRTALVHTGKAHCEEMFSALPLIPGIGRCDGYGSFVPTVPCAVQYLYSITSSAVIYMIGGTVRPSVHQLRTLVVAICTAVSCQKEPLCFPGRRTKLMREANELPNSMRGRPQAFDEPLCVCRQCFEISNANSVVPKRPVVCQRDKPDCHRSLKSPCRRFRQYC